jgi:prepilin-type N-terminal cleavage/methylation domain-containing protein
MRRRKGFTLIELMVVILIVGILAAVSIPLMRGRIDSAKWSEGKAIMGTIATSLRAHVAEKGAAYTKAPSLSQLGFSSKDLDGTYFTSSDFSWSITAHDPIAFTITAKAPSGITSPSQITMNEKGVFTETESN